MRNLVLKDDTNIKVRNESRAFVFYDTELLSAFKVQNRDSQDR